MGFILAIFIVFLSLYFLPRILMWLAAYVLRRKVNRAFSDAFPGMGGQSAKNKRNDKRQSAPETSKPAKKIDPTVGEYVHFEEVEVTTESTERTNADGSKEKTTKITVEDQIVDVEWEDI